MAPWAACGQCFMWSVQAISVCGKSHHTCSLCRPRRTTERTRTALLDSAHMEHTTACTWTALLYSAHMERTTERTWTAPRLYSARYLCFGCCIAHGQDTRHAGRAAQAACTSTGSTGSIEERQHAA